MSLELLQKIAYQEKIAFGLLKRITTAPDVGEVYDPTNVKQDKLEAYLTRRLSKSAYETVEEIIEAAKLVEIPIAEIKKANLNTLRPIEVGQLVLFKNEIAYEVLFVNDDVALLKSGDSYKIATRTSLGTKLYAEDAAAE